MSVDVTAHQPPRPEPEVDHSIDAARSSEALLLSVARGDQEALLALERRMAGLVRVNVRRVLQDASRSEAVTRETFDEVLEDAVLFDPDRDSAETWLLTRAHRHAMDGLGCIERTADPGGVAIDQPASALLA